MTNIEIGGRLHSTATGNIVTGANEVLDDIQNKKQQEINAELIEAVGTGGSVDTRIENAINSLDATLSQTAEANNGGLNLQVTETDGKITGLSGSINPNTYDEYGAASEEATRAKNAENELDSRVTTNENDIESLQEAYRAITQSQPIPKTSEEWAAMTSWEEGVVYRVQGTTSYADYMYNGTTTIKMAEYDNAIDDVPTAGSDNLVKSGGIQEELALGAVYDVSAKNPTAGVNNDGKFESLSALLEDANLGTLIPISVRKGGMTIKYIQSSDNKYVQYRLMAQNFTTDVTQWQGVDDEPTANSKNLVESGGVYPTFASVRSLNSFAFTDNTSLNAIISNCRVLIKNSNIATLGIRLAKAADNYFRFYTYAADGTETLKIQQSYTNYYDAANKLFVYSDADIEVYLNFDVSAISDTLNGKFTTAAYISDNYFDTYPNDRYVKINDVDPTSGKQLSKLMTVRSAVLGIILYEQCHQINLYNGFNSVYGIRVYSSASEFEMFTFPEGLVGIVQLGTKGYIYIDTTKLTSGEMYIFVPINTTVFDNPFLESKLHHIFYCGHNRELSTLKAGIEEATKYMDSILYVDEGVYNLVEEFGSDYFENAVAGKTYGLFLKNRIHVIFSANSKVVSHYQGNNQYALSLYSPINAGEYGFTIENMNLECSRCRYAIHDERNGATEQYQSIYKNCHIKFDNSILNPSWDSQAVFGGGFGSNATVIIDSCILEFTENKNRLGYYHESNDNSNPNHAFKFIMKNCYLINGSFGISIARTDATKLSYITITNNCFPSEPGADNEGFAAYLFSVSESEGHYKYIAWNNKVRA